MCSAAYLIDLFQHQRTDPPPLVFDEHLAELVPVCSHRADFPYGVLIAHPVKEIIDPARRSLSERVIWVDVHRFAVSRQIYGQWEIPRAQRKGLRHTLSRDLPSDLYATP